MSQALKALQAKQASNRFALICAASGITISVGAFLVDFLPNTLLVDRYKKSLHMLKLGQEVPLDKNVKNLFYSVLDDLKLDDKEKEKYEPFTVGGFEVYHAGVPTGICHSVIGIPINFTYESKLAIEASEIRIGLDREPLNVYHPAADNLLESLILSEKAKKFAIAREILSAQYGVPIYRSIESPVVFIGSVFLAELARTQMNLPKKPFSMTILVYGVSGIMGIMSWLQLRDATNTYFEKQVDKQLAELGQEYIEGGKEYYEKILKRNIALRTLLGEYGAKVYKKDGDEVIGIRQKRIPISYRKKFFSEYTLTTNAEQTA